MTDITMALKELLRKHETAIDSDFLQEGVQIMMQMLIELEAGQQIGAGRLAAARIVSRICSL